jgi:hypothetical protein
MTRRKQNPEHFPSENAMLRYGFHLVEMSEDDPADNVNPNWKHGGPCGESERRKWRVYDPDDVETKDDI